MNVYVVDKLMAQARRLAADYRRATGKTLPISGEIAINDAIRLLRLAPSGDPQAGHDAIREGPEGRIDRLQIKARVVFEEIKSAHRLGELKIERPWEALLLVLLDENYEPFAIYEASREAVEDALDESKANKRGTLTIPKFQRIGQMVWSKDDELPTSGAPTP